jgi:hypothetical protein
MALPIAGHRVIYLSWPLVWAEARDIEFHATMYKGDVIGLDQANALQAVKGQFGHFLCLIPAALERNDFAPLNATSQKVAQNPKRACHILGVTGITGADECMLLTVVAQPVVVSPLVAAMQHGATWAAKFIRFKRLNTGRCRHIKYRYAMGMKPITPGTADFLIPAFCPARHVGVHGKANATLVDPHTKTFGGDQYVQVTPLEGTLVFVPDGIPVACFAWRRKACAAVPADIPNLPCIAFVFAFNVNVSVNIINAIDLIISRLIFANKAIVVRSAFWAEGWEL